MCALAACALAFLVPLYKVANALKCATGHLALPLSPAFGRVVMEGPLTAARSGFMGISKRSCTNEV